MTAKIIVLRPNQAIPQEVVEAEWYDDSITESRWVCLKQACGHWSYSETLPSGFPSTESLVGAILGCAPCGESLADLAEHAERMMGVAQ
jgi:hypothetical protein